MRCKKTYERVVHASQLAGTHTCDHEAGHQGSHHCPRCGTDWWTPHRRRLAPPNGTTISLARQGLLKR